MICEEEAEVFEGAVSRKRRLQKKRIVEHLYFHGPELTFRFYEELGLSFPSFKGLLGELMKEGIIKKVGIGKSTGGRKPVLYGLEEDYFYILIIQVKQGELKMSIVNGNNDIVKEAKNLPFEINKQTNIAEQLFPFAEKLIFSSGINPEKLAGVGVTVADIISSEEGKNFTYFLTEEESESLQQVLAKKFSKPVYIFNDAKSACLGEFHFGQARNKKNVLVISMDWGIGLGIIIDGKMHHGASGFAGEFGHIPLVEDGDLCHCGKRGCLETVASGLALAKMAKEGIHSGESSILKQLPAKEIEKIEPQVIIEAANKGDQFAINIFSEVGANLGKGIAILIQVFNPELVVLEGKFAEAKQFITTPIQQSINTYCMSQLREKTKIALSNLGQDAALLGSVAAVMENVLGDRRN